ncbi:MAG TPA: hypothetical protein VGP89_00370 [Candidatus Angelobacter sp.]|jgi:hypothetical protein|nr:hypothetical protein [Candidatus Angelobacter sp.]
MAFALQVIAPGDVKLRVHIEVRLRLTEQGGPFLLAHPYAEQRFFGLLGLI